MIISYYRCVLYLGIPIFTKNLKTLYDLKPCAGYVDSLLSISVATVNSAKCTGPARPAEQEQSFSKVRYF